MAHVLWTAKPVALAEGCFGATSDGVEIKNEMQTGEIAC